CFNATNNIFEIMNREPAIKDRPGAEEISGSDGDIRIESVTFRYRPGLHAAVHDLSLHISLGNTTPWSVQAERGKARFCLCSCAFMNRKQGSSGWMDAISIRSSRFRCVNK